MKGLTHFVTGVAFASFWPDAVHAAAAGNPACFVLGGVAGLLPDTLDFRIARYVFRHDVEVIPDPRAPDPAMIAGTLADAIHQARATGKPVRVRLHTARVGAGLWGQYRLTFDETQHTVTVVYSGVVTTGRSIADERSPEAGGDPTLMGWAASPLAAAARKGLRAPPRGDTDTSPLVPEQTCPVSASVPLECSITTDYQATTDLDIFDGPTFTLVPQADGRVRVAFIPWHRYWSHSIVFAASLGLLAGWFGGFTAALVTAGACGLHILADQLGFMGANLFFPFTRERLPGYQLVKSDAVIANFAVIWIACLLTCWNLARLAAPPTALPLMPLLFYAVGLPLAVLRCVQAFLPRRVDVSARYSTGRRSPRNCGAASVK